MKIFLDPFHQQQEVSGLQKAYIIWNGTGGDLRCLTMVEKASQISVNRKTAHLQRVD
jgi:hypothetical protein